MCRSPSSHSLSHLNRSHNNAGVVLITVLLIFAATTLLVVNMQVRFVDSARLQGAIGMDSQIRAYHFGAELQAGIQLQLDALEDQKQSRTLDHGSEVWGLPQTYPIDGGEIRTQLVDLQGRFNLTGLDVDQNKQAVFIRLLAELNIPADGQVSPQEIMDILLDWMDSDQVQRGFIPAEDDYYISLGLPGTGEGAGYNTSQMPLHHVSELLLIRGISKLDYVELSKHVTFLPMDANININTVSMPLARALNPNSGADLVVNRPSSGYTTQDMSGLSASVRPSLDFDVSSQYFELRSEVELSDMKSRQTALLFMPDIQAQQAQQAQQQTPSPLILERDSGWSYYYSL